MDCIPHKKPVRADTLACTCFHRDSSAWLRGQGGCGISPLVVECSVQHAVRNIAFFTIDRLARCGISIYSSWSQCL